MDELNQKLTALERVVKPQEPRLGPPSLLPTPDVSRLTLDVVQELAGRLAELELRVEKMEMYGQ